MAAATALMDNFLQFFHPAYTCNMKVNDCWCYQKLPVPKPQTQREETWLAHAKYSADCWQLFYS